MPTLKFDITADDSNFRQKLNGIERAVNNSSSKINKESRELESVFGSLSRAAAGVAAAFSAQSMIRDIVRVRGEFQQLEVAFSTMLQSREKAETLMSEATEFAAKTPFDLQGVAAGIKQLLAYGTAAEDAIDTVEMLGNVSAGLSVPLGDMIYLYGTLKSQGRAMLVDIRQFAGRGVPIYEELAKVLGTTTSEVNKFISAGKVGFPEVEQAFRNMTSEGGKFYNLMQEQSKTITGQISNLQDSIDMMFNEMGKNAEGVITDVISGASYVVEHYRDVVKILGTLIATYGSYRATLMLVSAVQKSVVAAETASRIVTLTTGVKNLTQAFRVFNTVLKANPIGLVVSLITGLVATISSFAAKQREAREEVEAAVKSLQDEYVQVNDLVSRLNDANVSEDERLRLLNELKELAPEVASGIDDESSSLESLNENLEAYNNMQLAKIAVKRFSMESGFDESVENLTEARDKLQAESAELYNVYSELYARFAELDSRGLIKDDVLQSSIAEIFGDAEATVTEKVNSLFAMRDAIYDKVKSSHGAYTGSDRYDVQILFGDLDIDEYRKQLVNAEAAEDEYAKHAEELSEKIRTIAEVSISDEKQRQSFITGMLDTFGIKKASGSGGDEDGGDTGSVLPKDFDTQVAAAKKSLEDARKTLADLKSGILPDDADKDFDFAASIKEAEKALKEAESRYNTLTGYDPKAYQQKQNDIKKSEEAAAAELADVRRRIADEEYELQRKSTDDRLELIELEKSRALQSLQEELDTARAIYEQMGLPVDELESQYRRLADITAKSYDADASKERSDRAEKQREEFEAVLQEYETYQQARRRIEEKYEEDRRRLTNEDGSLKEGVVQENLDEISRREQEEIASVSETFAMRDAAFESWSNSLAGKTRDALELMLSEAVEQLSILEATEGADPDAVAKATAAVSALQKKLKSSDTETEKSSASWTDLNGVLQGSAEIFSELGEQIPGVAGQLLSGIGSIATSAASMSAAITGIATAASAAEKATAILAVISVALQVLSIIPNTINANIEATEEATQAAWEYAEALEEVQRNSRLEKYDTIFGKDSLGEFQETVKLYEQLADKLKSQKASYFSSQGEVTDYFADNSLFDTVSKVKDQYVTADFRSGWQKFWGTGDDNIHTFNLSDYINDDGTVKVAELQAMYDAYAGGMDESSKRLVDSLLNDGKAMEKYLESMRDYISGLFDDVSGNIADSMITAFEETGDAANATFDDIKNDIAKTFAKNAIVNLLHKNVFTEEAQSKMMEMMQNGDSEGALDYLDVLVSQAERLAPAINETLKGLDVAVSDDSSERTTASKGIAQASQESVDELNGRATAIQSHTYSISTDMRTLVNTSSLMLDRLTAIEYNTARLEAIETGVSRMRSDINTIMVKGIHIR